MKVLIFCICFIAVLSCAKRPANTLDNKQIVSLGKALFFDTRLSANGTKSCSSCHSPSFAFTDGYRRSSGIEADETMHNSPSLLNTALYKSLTWSNPNTHTLEQQMLGPLFKQHPPEMGLDSNNLAQIAFLKEDEFYKKQFEEVFSKEKQIFDYQHVIKAIAAYERTLIDFNAPYDRYKKGDETAISASAKRGEILFFSDELQCGKCHPYPLFTDAGQGIAFHNIGYFNERDYGLFSVSGDENDKGKFRTPTLRNISRTAPYMHDGNIEKLSDVLSHFEKALLKSEIKPFQINEEQRRDLMAFLESLTSETDFTK